MASHSEGPVKTYLIINLPWLVQVGSRLTGRQGGELPRAGGRAGGRGQGAGVVLGHVI